MIALNLCRSVLRNLRGVWRRGRLRIDSDVAVGLGGVREDETPVRISSFVASDEGDVVWMG